MGMISAVVKELKTGLVKNVVKFGSTLPAAPYIVVKTEKGQSGRNIRVIAHFLPGQQNELEDYMRWIIRTLSEFSGTSRNGNKNQLGKMIDYTDIVVSNDDKTISMEALFLMPTLSF